MDNVDKSVDKLGSRAPHPLQLQGVYMVREGGLEPPHLSAPDPKSGVSTNSTTLATIQFNKNIFKIDCLHIQSLTEVRLRILKW